MAIPAERHLDEYKPPDWNPLSLPHTFRLINLAAGTGDDPLNCTLINAILERVAGIYIALSYAWGGQDLAKTILCSGYTVRITQNLHSALRRLRQPQRVISVWCDALCIKQGADAASLLERSQQIPMMDRIFSSAVRVIIDLGDDDGTLEQAVEGINAILRTPQDQRSRCHLEAEPQKFLNLPEFTHPMWRALGCFMSRPWFQRIWCVQEAVLARDIRVTFGRYCITFEQLISVASVYLIVSQVAARTLQTGTWDYLSWSRSTLATQCLLATWQKRKAQISNEEKSPMSFCDLIISTMSQHSTDRRDRVYALYGMAGPQIASDLPVSYFESVDALSRRLSDYLIHNVNAAWMLVHAGGIDRCRPSWTLDLNSLSARYKMDPLTVTIRATGESATYAAGGKSAIQMQANAEDDHIKLRGLVVSTIVSISKAIEMPPGLFLDEPGHGKITPQFILSCIKWFNSVITSPEWTSPDPDALWRTLMANFNPHADDSERDSAGRPLLGFKAYFDDLLAYINRIANADPPIDANASYLADFEQYHIPPLAVKFWIAAIAALYERRLARTDSNGFALVPKTSHLSDIVVVFRGVPVPFVLRKLGDGYQVVGISYVHGVMDGEAWEQGLPEEDFLLR